MAVAALLDLGIDVDFFRQELRKLNLHEYEIDIRETVKNGIRSKQFIVNCREDHHRHRNLADIYAIIDASSLEEDIRVLSRKIFLLLAEAEATVHGTGIDEVHFHEIGAVDSIVDIVSFAVCFQLLRPDRVLSSPVNLGSGLVRCAHGLLPVPAPAVAELARGVPVYSSATPPRELATPTGMAILKAVCEGYLPLPKIIPERVGYGAGQRDSELPNVLRVISGVLPEVVEVVILETNIDDMNPELYGYVFDKLLAVGALDVYLTNIMMKKNRPGQKLSVICLKKDEQIVEDILFRETSTIGLRKTAFHRKKLDRRIIKIASPYGEISVKVAYKDGGILKCSPEYEDCKEAAVRSGKPLREIYEEAVHLAGRLHRKERGG
ncbi:MAG TPA: nickel pincer cofactor biosynthesis protein LarC [Syntrophus sp. (in: bacteria)]|nr:nickel pincer cofactor biosynthesis protein LarC [Syntrophus sp. (in: bacteria)]